MHVPLLRAGRPYRSLATSPLRDLRSGEALGELSLANRGLIGRDLARAAAARAELDARPVAELLSICGRSANLFASGELPVDPIDGVLQSPEDFARLQSATTGMPQALCRANMEKIRFVLANMERVLGGLTRGVDLEVLDRGWVQQAGRDVSYLRQADVLGAVLPSNSPGVHSLWLPAIPLKTPLALKPGREEPWTPMRIAQALIAAGCPPQALGFYPTDYDGAAEILLRSQRSMLFGDASTVGAWRDDPRVQLHGPGWSKVLVGEDEIDRFDEHLEVIVASIADNGGRSCLNASGVWVPSRGREVAEAIARRLVEIDARPLDDPAARLCAFANPAIARRIASMLESRLDGAEDLTARLRGSGPLVECDGLTYLLPTVIWCRDPDHPLAACEFLFPFATVVECPQREMLERIGPTLVVTALSGDDTFRAELMRSRSVDRLNLGPVPTSRVSWDQPHEGNLFEHLWRQRAVQAAAGGGAR